MYTLVNKYNYLDQNYIPDDLVIVDTKYSKYNTKLNKTALNNFIKMYTKKAELYHNDSKRNYVVFSDGKSSCVINFNEKGDIIKKSSLIFEDEDNVLENVKKEEVCNFTFTITKEKKDTTLTRFEKDRKNFLLNNIKKISDNKLKFLYFDCFDKKNNNKKIIISKILKEIENNNQDIWKKCYNLINLVYQNK
jgi:hypothetical protein